LKEGTKVTTTENPFADTTEDEQSLAGPFEAEDLDVDTPDDDAAEDTATGEPATEGKLAKKTASARPSVPEGYTTPVQFAKMLTTYLHDSNQLDEEKIVAPQVVYSYIKNSQGGKNPFPVYSVGDRQWLLKLDDEGKPAEGLKWWQDKIDRVAASKQNAAAKATKKAEKASTDGTPVTDKEADQGPVEEAE
jgi:hypothetical protein